MDYTVLGLNGGGMRGVLQIGALQSLSEEKNEKYLHNVFTDGIYGISIGALIATLIAFEFSVDELDVLSEMLGNMQDAFQPLRLQSLLSFTQRNGIDDGSTIYTMIVREFQKKGMDFANLRIGDAAVPLYIVASNVTTLKTTVFGQSVKVWDALRSSISMPYIFTPHMINDQMYVDGAILCQRIVDVIPLKDREKMLLLLIAQSKGVTAENYMSALPLCRNNKDTYSIQRAYPKNSCLLIEDDAQMFTFWESADIVRHLLSVGRSSYGKFRSESVYQESPENT
jgi:predicted patatin/cPLA2 family phospholipase